MSHTSAAPAVGIIVNPMSGRDYRRLAARADTVTHEAKRNQIARAVVGAIAAGARRILVPYEPRRLATGAVENLDFAVDFEVIRTPILHKAIDTVNAVTAMRERGAAALIILGGDGTHRVVTKAWREAPMVAVSTGTNNVFPTMQEPTLAGMAAGLVASGRLKLMECAQQSKVVEVEIEGEEGDLALIDAVLLENDSLGNLAPFASDKIRTIVLARAEPAAVGISPIGGLLHPCGADDEFGVTVNFCTHLQGGRLLRAPFSPGLIRTIHVADSRTVPLGEAIEVKGPALLAFDGDRERLLAPGQRAWLKVVRSGPWVIDSRQALRLAAERGLMLDLDHWSDPYDGVAGKTGCC